MPYANIYGTNGDDNITLLSGASANLGPGNDTLTGGGAAYWDSPAAIYVDLSAGYALDGFGFKDKLINVSSILTAGKYSDAIYGTAKSEWFTLNSSSNNNTKNFIVYLDGKGGGDTANIHNFSINQCEVCYYSDINSFTISSGIFSAAIKNIDTFWFNGYSASKSKSEISSYFKAPITTKISSQVNSINTGDTLIISVNSSYVAGQSVPYLIGGTVNSSDLKSNQLYGLAIAESNGNVSIPIQLASHGLYQGDKSLTVYVGGNSLTTTVVDTAIKTLDSNGGLIDFYDGKTLKIPKVKVGADIYKDVVITVGEVIKIAETPSQIGFDTYERSNNQLTISAVNFGGTIYKNVIVTVGSIITFGSNKSNLNLISTKNNSNSNIDFNFDQNISVSSGQLTLISPNGSQGKLDLLSSPFINISGNKLSVNTSAPIFQSVGVYQISIPSNSIHSNDTNEFLGANNLKITLTGIPNFVDPTDRKSVV